MNEDGKVELKDVTDGTYSASGTLDDLNIIKGTPEDLLKNVLTVKVNINESTRNILITVETIEGVPNSYTYKIEGPNNYSKMQNKTTNTHTFDKLKPNTEYTVVVTVKNKSGLTKEITRTVNTQTIDNITLDLNPKDTYIKEGTITITYPTIEAGLVNKYKWEDDEDFTSVTGNSIEVDAQNGTLITVVLDGEETVTQNSITVQNLDDVPPEITLSEVQKTTNSITIPYTITEEHIDEITCKYSDTIDTYTSNGTIGENSCSLSNELKNNKTYYYQICVTDLAGNKTCQTGNTNTEEITNPGVNIKHYNKSGNEITTPSTTSNGYSYKEVAHITFTNTHITNPTYYIKSTQNGTTNNNVVASCTEENNLPKVCTNISTTNISADTWYKVSGNINITYTNETETPITIYATTYDGKNFSTAGTGTTIMIDTTGPELTPGTITKTTNSMVINYTLSDTKSGVDTNTITCALGVSKGTYNINGTATSTSCTATGLKDKQTYYYKICSSDKVGNNKCYDTDTSESTEEITNPGISITHTPSNAGAETTNGYSKEEVAHVIFTSTNITNPTYYIKSTQNGTTNINVVASCTEENNLPKTCTNTSTKNIVADTWYKVSGDINITYNTETKTPITVKAVTYDGKNYSASSTGTTILIDRGKPEITFGTNGNSTYAKTQSSKVTITEDESGINVLKYKWSTSNEEDASNGTTFTSGDTLTTPNNLTGTYYLCVYASDKVENEKNRCSQEFKLDNEGPTPPTLLAYFDNDETKVFNGGWSSKSFKIKYTSTDSKSGVASFEYSFDKTNWMSSDISIIRTGATGIGVNLWENERNQKVYFRAKDALGNPSEFAEFNVQIDKTRPTVSYSLVGGTYSGAKIVEITVSDTNFNYMNVHVYQNGTQLLADNGIKTSTYNVMLGTPGSWTIYTIAYDKAGNKQLKEPDNNNGKGFYYQDYTIQ